MRIPKAIEVLVIAFLLGIFVTDSVSNESVSSERVLPAESFKARRACILSQLAITGASISTNPPFELASNFLSVIGFIQLFNIPSLIDIWAVIAPTSVAPSRLPGNESADPDQVNASLAVSNREF